MSHLASLGFFHIVLELVWVFGTFAKRQLRKRYWITNNINCRFFFFFFFFFVNVMFLQKIHFPNKARGFPRGARGDRASVRGTHPPPPTLPNRIIGFVFINCQIWNSKWWNTNHGNVKSQHERHPQASERPAGRSPKVGAAGLGIWPTFLRFCWAL